MMREAEKNVSVTLYSFMGWPVTSMPIRREACMLHVMIDLYGCSPALLANEALLRRVLDEYPDRIGMDKVSPVFLREIKTSNPFDDGMSGFVIIATSHVSLHAWPCYGMVNIDVFSCEEFSPEEVSRFAVEMFQARDVEVHAVERATRSPRAQTALV
jgi:S-adenosylmethionine decarboxylase